MSLVAIGEDSGIDLCPKCGAVFLDFFDGDPGIVARALSEHLNDPSNSWTEGLDSTEALCCPDCECELNSSLYGGDGPSLFRCPKCASVFLSKRQFRELANYEETLYLDENEDDWFRKLVRALRSLLPS